MSVNNTKLFIQSINAHLEYLPILYCKNCNESELYPSLGLRLCPPCLTSIGEATLVRFLSHRGAFNEHTIARKLSVINR